MFTPAERLFNKKWKFLPFWGPRSHPRELIGMKFRVAKRTHVHPGHAKFHVLGPRSNPRELIGMKFRVTKRTHVPPGHAKFPVNWCNESPLWGENADFWPVSKFNAGSLPLRGILPVIKKK